MKTQQKGNLYNSFHLTCLRYPNDTKFSDRQVWAKSANPDQTDPKKQSGQTLPCLLIHLHLMETFSQHKGQFFRILG